MIVPVMALSNLVLTQQIYSERTNGAHAHNRDRVWIFSILNFVCLTYHNNVWNYSFKDVLLAWSLFWSRSRLYHIVGIFRF